MRIDILTLFPEMFASFLDGSLLGEARRNGLIEVCLTNIRDHAEGVHRQVDDRPYGGGPGMLLMPGPVVSCVESVQREGAAPGHLVMLTPGGRRLDQALVEELSRRERLVLLCGRYEGFDDRIRATLDPDMVSIGDYVLSGGEVAAMVIVDAVARLLPGVLGDAASAHQDSFSGADRLVEGPPIHPAARVSRPDRARRPVVGRPRPDRDMAARASPARHQPPCLSPSLIPQPFVKEPS